MQNVFKGYVTTILGLIVMGLDILHFFGIVTFPHPSMLDKNTTAGIAFLVGLILFLVPATKLEGLLEKKAGDVIDKGIK